MEFAMIYFNAEDKNSISNSAVIRRRTLAKYLHPVNRHESKICEEKSFLIVGEEVPRSIERLMKKVENGFMP
jgi:hypothetical protein